MYQQIAIPIPSTLTGKKLAKDAATFNHDVEQLDERRAAHDAAQAQLLTDLPAKMPADLADPSEPSNAGIPSPPTTPPAALAADPPDEPRGKPPHRLP